MLKTPPFHHLKVTLTTFTTTTTFHCIRGFFKPNSDAPPVFSQSLLQLQPGAIDCWKSRFLKLPSPKFPPLRFVGGTNIILQAIKTLFLDRRLHWVWMISRPKKRSPKSFNVIMDVENHQLKNHHMLRRRDVPSTQPVRHAERLKSPCEGWSLLPRKGDNRDRGGWYRGTSYHRMTIWRSILKTKPLGPLGLLGPLGPLFDRKWGLV